MTARDRDTGSVLIGLAFVVLIVGLLWAAFAHAAPPPGADPDGATAQWFQGLKQPGTQASCCSLADCRHEPSRTGRAGYEVFLGGQWLAVPAEKVLNNHDNPTGESVTCHNAAMIYCFVPGLET